MATPSPKKLHKRFAPSRTGSDFSCSTQYSSSSTLVYEERFATPPISRPSKPWAIKALNQLGLKCKKSMTFGKGKKETEDNVFESDEDDLQKTICPYTRTPPPFVLDIRREANERIKQEVAERGEELELLPECPQMLRRAPSANALLRPKDTRERQLTNLRLGSTPNLQSRPKRDSLEDPFYLETLINEFPRPPVHKPGEYASRAPVNPRVRRQNSNFSLPTCKAYPDRAKMQAKHWINRPVPRDMLQSRAPLAIIRSDSGQLRGL